MFLIKNPARLKTVGFYFLLYCILHTVLLLSMYGYPSPPPSAHYMAAAPVVPVAPVYPVMPVVAPVAPVVVVNSPQQTQPLECPFCCTPTQTIPIKKAGKVVWIWCCVLTFTTGCCCIPFFVDSCQDTHLTCASYVFYNLPSRGHPSLSSLLFLLDYALENIFHLVLLEDLEEVAEALVLDHTPHELHAFRAIYDRFALFFQALQRLASHQLLPLPPLPPLLLLLLLLAGLEVPHLGAALVGRGCVLGVRVQGPVLAEVEEGALGVFVVGVGGGGPAGVRHAAEAEQVGPGPGFADAEVLVLLLLEVVVDEAQVLVGAEDEKLEAGGGGEVVLDGLEADAPLGVAAVLALALPRAALENHLLAQQLHDVRVDVGAAEPLLQHRQLRELPHPPLHQRHVLLDAARLLHRLLEHVEEGERGLEERGQPLEKEAVEDGSAGRAREAGVGEEADEPLEGEGECDDEAVLALHVPHDAPHLAHRARVRLLQHLEQQPDQRHRALHRGVEVAGQQLLRDALQHEERLRRRPPRLQQEQHHRVHALAVPDEGVVLRRALQHLRHARPHLRLARPHLARRHSLQQVRAQVGPAHVLADEPRDLRRQLEVGKPLVEVLELVVVGELEEGGGALFGREAVAAGKLAGEKLGDEGVAVVADVAATVGSLLRALKQQHLGGHKRTSFTWNRVTQSSSCSSSTRRSPAPTPRAPQRPKYSSAVLRLNISRISSAVWFCSSSVTISGFSSALRIPIFSEQSIILRGEKEGGAQGKARVLDDKERAIQGSDEEAAQLLLLAALEQLVGLLEPLDEEVALAGLGPAGIVRLVEGVLDGEGGLGVEGAVGALVDGDHAVVLILLPEVLGVVAHEAGQLAVEVDALLETDLLRVLAELVVDAELLDVGLLHALELEAGLVSSEAVVKDWAGAAGLDEVVDEHEDDGVGGEHVPVDEAARLAPQLDEQSECADPAHLRVHAQELGVDHAQHVVHDQVNLHVDASALAHLHLDQRRLGCRDQLHVHAPPPAPSLLRLVLLPQELVQQLQELHLVHVAVRQDRQVEVGVHAGEPRGQRAELAQAQLQSLALDDVEPAEALQRLLNELDLVLEPLLRLGVVGVGVLLRDLREHLVERDLALAAADLEAQLAVEVADELRREHLGLALEAQEAVLDEADHAGLRNLEALPEEGLVEPAQPPHRARRPLLQQLLRRRLLQAAVTREELEAELPLGLAGAQVGDVLEPAVDGRGALAGEGLTQPQVLAARDEGDGVEQPVDLLDEAQLPAVGLRAQEVPRALLVVLPQRLLHRAVRAQLHLELPCHAHPQYLHQLLLRPALRVALLHLVDDLPVLLPRLLLHTILY